VVYFYLKIENEPAITVLRMSFLGCHLSKLPAPSADNVVAYLLSVGLAMDLTIRDVIAVLSTCKHLNTLMDCLVVTGSVRYRKTIISYRPHFTRVCMDLLPIINGEIEVPLEVTSLFINEETLIDGGCLLAPKTREHVVFTQVSGIDHKILSVTELNISHCTIDNLSILECFPKLQTLSLRFSHGNGDYYTHPLLLSPVDLPNLVELEVIDCEKFDYKVLLNSAPNLKKISIDQSRTRGLIHTGVTEFHCVEYDLDLAGLTGLRVCHYSTYDAIDGILIENIARCATSLRELYITAGELHGEVEPLKLDVFELKITG
jgi:hypothetical protein